MTDTRTKDQCFLPGGCISPTQCKGLGACNFALHMRIAEIEPRTSEPRCLDTTRCPDTMAHVYTTKESWSMSEYPHLVRIFIHRATVLSEPCNDSPENETQMKRDLNAELHEGLDALADIRPEKRQYPARDVELGEEKRQPPSENLCAKCGFTIDDHDDPAEFVPRESVPSKPKLCRARAPCDGLVEVAETDVHVILQCPRCGGCVNVQKARVTPVATGDHCPSDPKGHDFNDAGDCVDCGWPRAADVATAAHD